MNENITIKEGNISRRLSPIDKLKINTTDNKESTWVSAGKANTGVLHASENGIYIASEDGYEAYSEVIVRVTKDSYDGDTSFDDWDYETPDMDLSNWDPETIEEFETDPESFDDVFNNEDEWKDIDKPIDIKMDNPKIQDTKISGIDPVTGNEMEVGLDEDGYLTESTLPSSIKIEVLPDKLQYVEGQPIIIRGMVVKAYTADGELWTDGNHSDGVIQHSELNYNPNIAIIDDDSKKWGGDGIHAIRLVGGDVERDSGGATTNFGNVGGVEIKVRGVDGFSGKEIWATQYDNSAYLACPDVGGTLWITVNDDTLATHTVGNNTFTLWQSNIKNNAYFNWPPTSEVNPSGKGFDNLQPEGQTIIVSYIRSDGEVLEDSFTIEVLPDPDGAHPQVDPSTVEWNHRKYKANEDLGAVEVRHGSVYMEGGAIYDVGAAVRLGMLEPVDNEIVP